ncbi:MAG: hypothetical protein WCV86_05525 [Patescibacteria group bacterium]
MSDEEQIAPEGKSERGPQFKFKMQVWGWVGERLKHWPPRFAEANARRLVAEAIMDDLSLGEEIGKHWVDSSTSESREAAERALSGKDAQVEIDCKDSVTGDAYKTRLRKEGQFLVAEEVATEEEKERVISQAKIHPDGQTRLTLNYIGSRYGKSNPGIVEERKFPTAAAEVFNRLTEVVVAAKADELKSGKSDELSPASALILRTATVPEDENNEYFEGRYRDQMDVVIPWIEEGHKKYGELWGRLDKAVKSPYMPEVEKVRMDKELIEIRGAFEKLEEHRKWFTDESAKEKMQKEELAAVAHLVSDMSGEIGKFESEADLSRLTAAVSWSEVLAESKLQLSGAELRKKVSQHMFSELVQIFTYAGLYKVAGMDYRPPLDETSEDKKIKMKIALAGEVWDEGKTEVMKQAYDELAKAFKKGVDKAVTGNLKELWAMANGEDMEKESGYGIILGSEVILRSLQNDGLFEA